MQNYPQIDGIDLEIDRKVIKIVLNRPNRLNAMTEAMQHGLVDIFDAIEEDDGVWVVVVRGAGDKAFSAGRDLKEMGQNDARSKRKDLPMKGVRRNVFETVYECSKPVIAGLNGWTVGGGLELALACDLRLAAEHTQLLQPEARRGLGANFASVMLPRMVPPAIASELLYFGDPITARQAYGWGLINRVVPSEDFDHDLDAYAQELATRAPLTIRRFKAVARKGISLPVQAALRLDPSPNPYRSQDRLEGVRAFTEKRQPLWEGR